MTSRPWRWVAGAGLLGVLALGAVAVVRPNLVRNVLTSPRTLLYALVVALVVVLLGLGVRRLTGRAWAGALAAAVPVGAVLALVVLPTFVPTTVDEPDPLADVVALAPVPAPTPTTLPSTTRPTTTSSAVPTSTPVTTTPAGPVLVASADFTGVDHDVTGAASLITLADGSQVVRFADFDVEPGPDYLVHLVPGAAQERPGGVLLGALKGTQGAQNYTVPAGTVISGDTTVLIWCRAFGVPVARATLVLSA